MLQQKLNFLQNKFLLLIEKIDHDQKPLWGKMNAQQMLEHTAAFFEVSTKKRHFDLVTPQEHLPKYREFLWSKKEFKENTKAPVLPEEPLPLAFDSYASSLHYLKTEVEAFFIFFDENPITTTQHPVFGPLNFDDWVQLHYKHVTHHLKQFGVQL